MTNCPDCGEYKDINCNQKTDGQGYNWTLYHECGNCGCEWEEETTKTITKKGKESD